MNTVGSHPGAINFRLTVMIVLILALMFVFLDYAERAEASIERQSILQLQRVVNSTLVVVFATHVARGQLDGLAGLEGANPFEFLREYEVLPATYRGEIEAYHSTVELGGWYYAPVSGEVVYVPFHFEGRERFRVMLSYDDLNANGRFDPAEDRFKGLNLARLPESRTEQ